MKSYLKILMKKYKFICYQQYIRIWLTLDSKINFFNKELKMLELTKYLENYLWPNFKIDNSIPEHILSIVAWVNKFSDQNVSMWRNLKFQELYVTFFRQLVTLKEERVLKLHEMTSCILF